MNLPKMKFLHLGLISVSLSACGSGDSAKNDAPISGESVYNRCKVCHSLSADEVGGIGPNLRNIMGASIAGRSDYQYSQALSSKGGTWDDAAMDKFLKSPQGFASGTRMSFAGLKKPEERAAIIAYLKQQAD